MDDKQQIYYIPENYLNESRVFQGQFKLRNLLEGAVMAGVVALIVYPFLAGHMTFETRLTILVMCCAPFLLLGVMGFNGDPLSVALASAYQWKRSKDMLLYNEEPRLLSQAPMDSSFSEVYMQDKIVDYFQARQQDRINKKLNRKLVAGRNFQFEDDSDVDPFVISKEDDLRRRAEALNSQPEPDGDEDEFVLDTEDEDDTLAALEELYAVERMAGMDSAEDAMDGPRGQSGASEGESDDEGG